VNSGQQVGAGFVEYPELGQTLSNTFDMNLVDVCLSATLPLLSLTDITTTVLAAPVDTSTFPAITDSVSTANAGVDLCGPVEYSIMALAPAGLGTMTTAEVTVNSATREISAAPTLNAHIDTYTVEFQARLTDYPTIASLDIFTLTVNPCVILAATFSLWQDVYTIGEGPKKLPSPTMTLTPVCQLPSALTYTLVGALLSPYISLNPDVDAAAFPLVVDSTDATLEGLQTFQIDIDGPGFPAAVSSSIDIDF